MKTALSIAGTDPSGGAGIQADLKTMTMNGVFAMSAITALVAQNTTGVREIVEMTPEFLGRQDLRLRDIGRDHSRQREQTGLQRVHRCFRDQPVAAGSHHHWVHHDILRPIEVIDNPNTHGTGCTLSSAIAANLAKGFDLPTSIRRSKDYWMPNTNGCLL